MKSKCEPTCANNFIMIGFAAVQRFKAGHFSSLETDVDPNLSLLV
ncbi:MAG: hypothetical protein RL693_1059 [Verrucomicrobiota bacterium]|jgi:tRNA A37 threonylcarbamoyltransferase TsaD